jgi:hypothetical protein
MMDGGNGSCDPTLYPNGCDGKMVSKFTEGPMADIPDQFGTIDTAVADLESKYAEMDFSKDRLL